MTNGTVFTVPYSNGLLKKIAKDCREGKYFGGSQSCYVIPYPQYGERAYTMSLTKHAYHIFQVVSDGLLVIFDGYTWNRDIDNDSYYAEAKRYFNGVVSITSDASGYDRAMPITEKYNQNDVPSKELQGIFKNIVTSEDALHFVSDHGKRKRIFWDQEIRANAEKRKCIFVTEQTNNVSHTSVYFHED